MKTPGRGPKDLRTIRLGIVGLSLVAPFVNALSVLSIDAFANLLIEPEVQALIDRVSESWIVEFVSRVLPFPFLILAQALFSARIGKAFWNGRRATEAGRKASRALVSAPVFVGLITVAGWLFGAPAFLLAGPILLGALPAHYFIENLVEILVLASASYILSYYLAETILRRVLIPRLFRENEVLEIRAAISQGIGARLVTFALAVGAVPALMFATTILILNDEGRNAAGLDLVPTLVGTLLVFGALLALVTWLKSRTIEAPLVELRAAAARLGAGDFGARITVSSDDEIGALGGAFNDMARGLEERERMRAVFGRVVDPRVRDRLMAGGEEGTSGRLQEATVVFLDLEGFTTISESLPPGRVVDLLGHWFQAATESVEGEGGLVNKFIGDGVLAVFGVPEAADDHAERALLAMEALRDRMAEVATRLGAAGFPALRFRAGIHTGTVLAGIVGTRERQEYTVIGDAVNVAARLEPLGKEFQVQAVLSRATRDAAAPGREYKALGECAIRGKKEKLELFALASDGQGARKE